MIAKVSVKGQMVIPEGIRDQARIKSGDELEVGFFNGLIVLRKRRPLTPARVRALLLAGRSIDLAHVLLCPYKGIVVDMHPAPKWAVDIGDGEHHEGDQEGGGKDKESMHFWFRRSKHRG